MCGHVPVIQTCVWWDGAIFVLKSYRWSWTWIMPVLWDALGVMNWMGLSPSLSIWSWQSSWGEAPVMRCECPRFHSKSEWSLELGRRAGWTEPQRSQQQALTLGSETTADHWWSPGTSDQGSKPSGALSSALWPRVWHGSSLRNIMTSEPFKKSAPNINYTHPHVFKDLTRMTWEGKPLIFCPISLSLPLPSQFSFSFWIIPRNASRLPWWLSGKESACNAEAAGDTDLQVQSLGQEDPLEEGMATYSSILAWRISRTEELEGYSP